MTDVVLVRHGETAWNTTGRLQGTKDILLNETGVSQARAVASLLAAEQWDVVITSPLARAYDTAVQIVGPLGIAGREVVVDPRLRERFYGAAEGMNLMERESRWPHGRWPDAETHEALDLRTGPVMHEFAETHAGKRVVIVTHGGWIRSVLRVLSGHNTAIIELAIPNASCSWITHDGEKWMLGEIGSAEHLAHTD